MAERPEQTGPVVVYGATGYTGQLVAEVKPLAEEHQDGELTSELAGGRGPPPA